MYSLDINFIKERPEFKPSRFVSGGAQNSVACREFVSTIFGARNWPNFTGSCRRWVVFLQNARLEQKIAQIDADLNRLGIPRAEKSKKLREQTNQIQAETQH